jgi:hypothetical protein
MQLQDNFQNDQELFQFALSHDIIDLENLKGVVIDMNRKEILSQHKHAITQGKDGRWSTRISLENGKSVVRHRKTKEELEDYLVDYYRSLQEAVYIKDVFWLWMNEKLDYGEIKKQSYDKYCAEYKRFFRPQLPICRKKFKYITEQDLEQFIKTTIRDLGLTRKGYSGLVTLLNGIFKYGKSCAYLFPMKCKTTFPRFL